MKSFRRAFVYLNRRYIENPFKYFPQSSKRALAFNARMCVETSHNITQIWWYVKIFIFTFEQDNISHSLRKVANVLLSFSFFAFSVTLTSRASCEHKGNESAFNSFKHSLCFCHSSFLNMKARSNEAGVGAESHKISANVHKLALFAAATFQVLFQRRS